MPLVGRDWSHSGVARLFSAIKENGYQLLFLSARAIVQAYLTKNFLFNLKQLYGEPHMNSRLHVWSSIVFNCLYKPLKSRPMGSQGEVAVNSSVDVKSYTSLHTLVHDMFPPTTLVEQEDYNNWNYWKVPLPDVDL
ncbi:unnamed protein product [Miscanthus lutarioriparius]|uniref:LNS2/PITP domain-containing protein n=1 Tax=Miscanthus lutarioriparius TaxID=422564 RepID=A0A811QC57_9POAL|nr:unnamed protein product [Miscanthus lutarioriparius]